MPKTRPPYAPEFRQQMVDLASAEFTTLRLRLLKVAARIVKARHRVRIAFAAACPEADVIAGLSAALIRRRI